MPLGKCKLCLAQGVDLQKSHLIPAGAYKAIRNSSGEPPIVMKSAITIKKDEQISAFVLCRNCEQRFSENGERWILEHCNQFDAGFKLNELIEQSTPVWVREGGGLYEGRKIHGLDIEKLAYFPSSVLWRGSVHDWHSGKDPTKAPKLGIYEESLRKYLLGQASFPKNAWQYTFPFLGIVFTLLFGKSVKPEFRRLCTYRSPEKFITKGGMQPGTLITAFGKLMAKTRVVGKLGPEP